MKIAFTSCLALILCFSSVAGKMPERTLASSPAKLTVKMATHVVGRNGGSRKVRDAVHSALRVAPRAETGPSVLRANNRTLRGHLTPQSSPDGPSSLPGQSSTLMPGGRVLLLGGEASNGPVASAFLNDPKTGTVTQLPN